MAGGRGATGTQGAGVQRTGGGSLQAERITPASWLPCDGTGASPGAAPTAVRRNRMVMESPS